MNGRTVEGIEKAVDAVAAALFAAAIGFCVLSLLRPFASPQPEVAGGAAFVASYLLCNLALRKVAATPRALTLPRFEAVLGLEPIELDELVLTEADRFHSENDEPLVLDDVLAEIEPDSRVVRLFDPSAMPTPGQLKARIDRHLDEGTAAPADASEALFEALAELRRSLA
jgi:hypothetical protein